MNRQAIADARSLVQAAFDPDHQLFTDERLGKAIIALCDALESLERDEGPRLPLDPDAEPAAPKKRKRRRRRSRKREGGK